MPPGALPSSNGQQTLDPADWDAFRHTAHTALDAAIDFLRDVRARPVWRPVPDEVKQAMAVPVPREPEGLDHVLQEFLTHILPYATGNIHPRFFGWVHGSGTAGGIVAEMLSAAMNANCGGRDHGAIYVERQIVDWCKELFGFPAEASGLLVSGTSMANLIGLGIARNARVDGNIRHSGLKDYPHHLVLYTSAEAHDSVNKALEILGLGSIALRKVPVDSDFRMNIAALRKAIVEDRSAGYEPFCVVGSAATVNTGAIDDLDAIAGVCAQENLWFHVDGAFGALCILSDELRPRLRGIERADSIGFDFHKWGHVQYDAGCLLVRRGDLHRASYSLRPPYLQHIQRGLGGGEFWPCEYGPELSRGFRALKVWFALKEHGTRKLGQMIEKNCQQARYLAGRVGERPELQLMAGAALNIVCFRYTVDGAGPEFEDRLNEDIVADLQESGIAAPSTTRIRGRLSIRVNITNHRSRHSDLDILLDAVVEAGRRRVAANPPATVVQLPAS
jgi:glutamate/tyrosine decarboxylase-like PLP-dependent enzyme